MVVVTTTTAVSVEETWLKAGQRSSVHFCLLQTN